LSAKTACLGFILARRHEFEAFDQDEESLGLFKTEDAAVEAITQKITATYVETSL
jgi:hypothetical protein